MFFLILLFTNPKIFVILYFVCTALEQAKRWTFVKKENKMRFRALLSPPKVLFGACSDDRLPVLSFLEEELCLPEGFYFPIRVGGGFSPLAHQDKVPRKFQAVLEDVSIITHKPTITTAIILEHADCTWRKTHLHKFAGNGIEDLHEIAEVLLLNLPQLAQIQLWYADLIGEEFDFRKIGVVNRQPILV